MHSENVLLDESFSLLIAREGIIAYECVKKKSNFSLGFNVMFINPRRKTHWEVTYNCPGYYVFFIISNNGY